MIHQIRTRRNKMFSFVRLLGRP